MSDITILSHYNSSSSFTSERSISSSLGNSPSLPSHASILLTSGNFPPLIGTVDPLPKDRAFKNSSIPD